MLNRNSIKASLWPPFLFLAFFGHLHLYEQHCLAATDGTLANPSIGTSDLSVTVPKLIIIRNMADIALGTYSGTGVAESNVNVSISMNVRSAARTYQVIATGNCTGNSPSNAFNVSDGTSLIPYRLFFNNQTGTTGEVELTAGTALGGRTGANFPLNVTTNNANYHVVFTQSSLLSAFAGSYSGTLSLVVSPQ